MQNKLNLEKLYSDYPDFINIIGSGGKEKRLTTSIFNQIPIFSNEKINNNYVQILGLIENHRVFKWIDRKYLENQTGYTQSFISIFSLDSDKHAIAALKYIKSKFARTLLGTLKIMQDNNKETWANVPMQDFSENSNIDWSKSIHEIDLQLYKKYNLSNEEIQFIESKVQSME